MVDETNAAAAPGFDPKAFAKGLTNAPGVYRMLDEAAGVLYVGKASSLRKRVSSYFMRPQLDPRLAQMVSRIANIEVTITRTEGEALLLENELIKSLKPRYNVLLRDDKSYPYIYLSTQDEFPRMAFHRGSRATPGRYFGPFPGAHAVRESLALMQKLFRVRQCEDSYFRNRSRPCLQYQIGRCSGPCVALIPADDYARDVRHATMFLDGQSTAVIDELVLDMEKASREMEFERAAALRDQIATLKKMQARQYVSAAEDDADVLACRVREGTACVHAMHFRNGMSLGGRSFFPRTPPGATESEVLGAFVTQYYFERPAPAMIMLSVPIEDADLLAAALTERRGARVRLRHAARGERARLVDIAARNADHALETELGSKASMRQRWESMSALLTLAHPPQRVECFDISHTMGEATVASCVVFGPEGPEKSHYRRFNIAGVTAGDDYAAMRQALERRFRRAKAEDGMLPDLLLIDGGKGQVAQARAVLAELELPSVTVAGVAKGPDRKAGLEALIVGEDMHELKPDAAQPGLHMIQMIRDEAHRFAITGHRARRQRVREQSRLEEIPGIGAHRRSQLLKHFGGWTGVVGAGVEELSQVPGISRALAARIYAALHE
ncbi:MAG TPA: excinuclease ABC subunit UvrC [Xanthomonadales bacterium]|nr:excinuclease ABC subunit UvrC [Xanthomonadales bacterium]